VSGPGVAGARLGPGRRVLLVDGGVAAAGFLVLDVAIRVVPELQQGLPLAVCRLVGAAGLVLAAVMGVSAVGLPGLPSAAAGGEGDAARLREEWASVLAEMRWWERVGFVADLAVRGVPRLVLLRLLRRRRGA
jgi:hypothetical protein